MFTENLFEETLNLYKDDRCKSITLNCIRSFLNNEDYQKSFVAHVNRLLNASSTRLDGLQLLAECIDKISPSELSAHGLFWVKCCVTNYGHSQNKEVFLNTLRNLTECSQKHSEFSRNFALQFLSPILDISLDNKRDLRLKGALLECICSCVKCYSSFCKQHKRKIEDYLLSILEASSEELVAKAGLTFFYCQKIPTIGNNTTSCIDNLSLSLRRLCATCHQCLDAIYENHIEIERFDVQDIEPFKISDPPLYYNSYLRLQYKAEVMKNVLEWMAIFFREGTGIIQYAQEILNILQRGLSLHICSKQESLDSEYLSFNLMAIQTKILQVLRIFISSMKMRLAPFYPFIAEILQNIIDKSKTCNCYKNLNVFQEYLYEILLELLLIGHGLEKPLQNALVSQIIEINTPTDDGTLLRVHTNLKGKSSKTVQNTILESITSKNNELQKFSFEKKHQQEVCISSLEGLLILLHDSSLDYNILRKVISFITNNILLLQTGNIKAPFNNKKCQELLYEILCSIFLHDISNIYSTFNEVINKIFINGCANENINISSTCMKGLTNMENIFINTTVNDDNRKNNITIFENKVLMPATKTEIQMETEVLEEEVHPVKEGSRDEMHEENFPEEEEVEEILLVEEALLFEEEKVEVKETLPIEVRDTIFTELQQEKFVKEENLQDNTDHFKDTDGEIEPVNKKRKIEEEDVESLFVNEFDDDYK